MTTQSLSVFNFQSAQVRVINRDGEIWFVASDIATVLKHRDATSLVRILDDDEKGTHTVCTHENGRHSMPTPGGDQEMLVINESGLYHAVLKSRKPEAKPFRKWVTAEVLPAIRKTGSYTLPRVSITPEQQSALHEIVDRRAGNSRKLIAQMWTRHNRHFRIAKYDQLLQLHFDDAVHYLETMELAQPKPEALPAPATCPFDLESVPALADKVSYDQMRAALRQLIQAVSHHQPYSQVRPAVVVMEAAERMFVTMWTMIDEARFRAALVESYAKRGQPLKDYEHDTICHIHQILARDMLTIQLPKYL